MKILVNHISDKEFISIIYKETSGLRITKPKPQIKKNTQISSTHIHKTLSIMNH